MDKAYERIVWHNEPSILTPLNETNLNKMDYSLDVIDDRVVSLDTTKADESEVLQLLESVTYNSNTGVFTFTWKNGSTYSVDLNIEKIPVSFSMSPQGVITMTTDDGTQYTADVGALIKLYTFVDSSEIDFTVTTDASGNKTVTAGIVAGSITGDKLQPNYLADCQAAKSGAETAENNSQGYAINANASALESEGFAVGEQNGIPVTEGSPYYHNNAKYYAQQSDPTRLESLSDVSMSTKKDKDLLMYDITDDKWENKQATELKLSDEKTTTTGKFSTINGGKLESCIVAFEPIQSGSGDPSPSNVRPITGHSSVEVGNHGKNYLPMALDSLKSANTSGTWSGNVYTLNNVAFTVNTDNDGKITSIKANGTASSNANFRLTAKENHNFDNMILSGCPSGGSSTTYYTFMQSGTTNVGRDTGEGFEIPTGYEDVATYLGISIRSGYNAQNVFFYPMLRLATNTDATFEPYQGQDVTVNLGGTYYGGSLDVVSGKLTISKAYMYLDGSDMTGWAHWDQMPGLIYYSSATLNALNNSFPICNELKKAQRSSSYSNDNAIAIDAKDLWVKNSRLTSISDWSTWLSSHPLQIVYELATPQTIQLTPQQINTLIGENHLDVPLEGQSLTSAVYRDMFAWDDVNDVVDTRLPISAIGTDESKNDTASQSYSQGDYFYKNGIAKAKTGIAQGATFTLNTNYEIKTLAEILQALEA